MSHQKVCPRYGWKKTESRDGSIIPRGMQWHHFAFGYKENPPPCTCGLAERLGESDNG